MNRTLTKVEATNWPYEITWTFDDGTSEKTHDDITTIEGKVSVAIHAEKLGLGNRKKNFKKLGGRDACIRENGVLLERGPVLKPPAPGDRSAKSAGGRQRR